MARGTRRIYFSRQKKSFCSKFQRITPDEDQSVQLPKYVEYDNKDCENSPRDTINVNKYVKIGIFSNISNDPTLLTKKHFQKYLIFFSFFFIWLSFQQSLIGP